MKNISHYFERWSRNSSSQALENDFKSQGEKRAKIVDRYRWQHSDLNALEMAKDIIPKNDSILPIVSVELWAYKWRETLKRKFTAIKKSKSDTITSRTFSLPMLPHAHFHRATITEQIKTLSDYALFFRLLNDLEFYFFSASSCQVCSLNVFYRIYSITE